METTNVINYTNASLKSYKCLAISTFLIIVFIFSPINSFLLSSLIGKIIILTLLSYTVFYNLRVTNNFTNKSKIKLTSGNWTIIKTNIILSYIFTIFLLALIVAIIRTCI